jgi:hypothetical protein
MIARVWGLRAGAGNTQEQIEIQGESCTDRCRPPQRYNPPADIVFHKGIAEERLTG